MLQIKLRGKGGSSSEGGGGAKPAAENVTVACPDHLTIADLPVAKSIGSVTAAPAVKIVGRKSRRQMGERVHICVRCDFPIAIYGRLSPCSHAFCLDCARSDSTCYLCEERIQKIQTIKMNEGILICAAPRCFKSFLNKDEFGSHIRQNHSDLITPNTRKEDGNESEGANARKPTTSDSTVQAPPKSVLSPSSSSHQLYDREDRSRTQQPRDQCAVIQPKLEPPFLGSSPNLVSDKITDSSNPKAFLDAHNQYPQENVDLQGMRQKESGQFPDSQLQVPNENSIQDYAMQFNQPPNNAMSVNSSQNPQQFIYSHFGQDGVPFYGPPFQPRQDSAPEPGSVLVYPLRPAVGLVNFSGSYQQPWGVGSTGEFFDPSLVGRGNVGGFNNLSLSNSQGRVAAFEGNFGQSQPSNMEQLPPKSLPPPPASHPPQSSHLNDDNFFSGGTS